jgi:hypothetical protein
LRDFDETVNGFARIRDMERRMRLTMETLDERIVPSQGQTGIGPIAVTADRASLSVSIPAMLDSVSIEVRRLETDSGNRSSDRHFDRDSRDDGPAIRDAEDSTPLDANRDPHGELPRPPAPDDAENRDAVPLKAINAWRERAMQRAEADSVRVDGSLGVEIHNEHIWLVSTDAPHFMSPTIAFVGPMNEGETDAASTENETLVRSEPVTPGDPAPKPESVAPPDVQPADNLTRFVPFSPAALDGAVRRFLDDLKSDDRDGLSLGGKAVAWAAVLASGVFVGELARRKKLPQKAIQFLSLSKYLTRTKTK